MAAFPHQLDHIILGVPDLRAGIALIEDQLGVQMLPGASHPAWGTRNAILPLGPQIYLEVIGPDPDAQLPQPPTLFGIDTLTTPRLVTWAAKGRRLHDLVDRARWHGIDLGRPSPGRRLRSDGSSLSWTLTDPFADRQGGILPFYIDWPPADHPATLAASTVELLELSAQHPDPVAVGAQLRALDIDLHVVSGESPVLLAALQAQGNVVVLR